MRTDSSDLPWHRVITASGPARRAPDHAAAGTCFARKGVLAVDGKCRCATRSRSATMFPDNSVRAPAAPARRSGPGRGRPQAVDRGCRRMDGEPEHQGAQQHLWPLRKRTPPVDQAVVGLAPTTSASTTTTPARPRRGPPVRRDVGDSRGGGASEQDGAVEVAVRRADGDSWSAAATLRRAAFRSTRPSAARRPIRAPPSAPPRAGTAAGAPPRRRGPAAMKTSTSAHGAVGP